jgi:hypothetical protein
MARKSATARPLQVLGDSRAYRAELRNAIYEELLTRDEDVCLWGPERAALHPQILRTCKEIHSKATSILYGGNIVRIPLNNLADYCHLREWTERVPACIFGMLKRIRFVSEHVIWLPCIFYPINHMTWTSLLRRTLGQGSEYPAIDMFTWKLDVVIDFQDDRIVEGGAAVSLYGGFAHQICMEHQHQQAETDVSGLFGGSEESERAVGVVKDGECFVHIVEGLTSQHARLQPDKEELAVWRKRGKKRCCVGRAPKHELDECWEKVFTKLVNTSNIS